MSGLVLCSAVPFHVEATEESDEYLCGDGHYETVEEFDNSLDSRLSLDFAESSPITPDTINATIPSKFDISTNAATRDFFQVLGIKCKSDLVVDLQQHITNSPMK